jgi:hypothetical protein
VPARPLGQFVWGCMVGAGIFPEDSTRYAPRHEAGYHLYQYHLTTRTATQKYTADHIRPCLKHIPPTHAAKKMKTKNHNSPKNLTMLVVQEGDKYDE